MAKYILKNIRILFMREKQLFSLMVIYTFLAGIVLSFCYGLFCNYIEKRNAQEYLLTAIEIEFNSDIKSEKYVTKAQIMKCIEQFSANITENAFMFFVRFYLENGAELECRFRIKNGEYYPCEIFRNNLMRHGHLNNYFSDDDERLGNKVIIVPTDDWAGVNKKIVKSMIRDDNTVLINGEVYEIIAKHDWVADFLVPFTSLDNDMIVDDLGLTIGFNNRVTYGQYKEVEKVVKENLGDIAIFVDHPELQASVRSLYSTAILVDALIVFVIAINFAILYQYILQRRKREIGIFLLCGLGRKRAVGLFTAGCFMLVFPCFLFGLIFYYCILLPAVSLLLPYINDGYNIVSYLCMTIVFALISLLVIGGTVAGFIHKTQIAEVVNKKSTS